MTGNVNSNAVAQQMQMPSNYWIQAYANQAGMFDMDSDMMGLNTLGVYNPMSMNGSLFGGMGMMGGMYPGYGYGPGSEIRNMSQADYMDYQADLAKKQMRQQLELGRQKSGLEFAQTAADDTVVKQAGILQRKIVKNEQDKVMGEYQKLIQATKEKLEEEGVDVHSLSEEQVKTYAQKMYAEATGSNIITDLEANGDGMFTKGLKEGIGCGLGALITNERTAKENIEAILAGTTDSKDGTASTLNDEDKAWRWTGRILSGAATLILAPLVLRFGGKGTAGLLKVSGKQFKNMVSRTPKTATP